MAGDGTDYGACLASLSIVCTLFLPYLLFSLELIRFPRRVSSLRLIKPDIEIQQSINVAVIYESKVFQSSMDKVRVECFTVVEWIAHVDQGFLRASVQGKAHRHSGNSSQAGHQSAAAHAKFSASLDEYGPAANADARHGAKPESSPVPAGIWRPANATTDASSCNDDATATDATAPSANGKPANEHATDGPKWPSPDASTTIHTRREWDHQSLGESDGPKHAQRTNGRHSKQYAEYDPRATAIPPDAKRGPHRLLFP